MAKTIQKTRFFLKFRGFPEVLEGRIFPISLALSRFFPKILGLETLFFINLDFLGSRDPRNFNSKNTILPVQTKIFLDLRIWDFLDPDPGSPDPILSVQINFWISRSEIFLDPPGFPGPQFFFVDLNNFWRRSLWACDIKSIN